MEQISLRWGVSSYNVDKAVDFIMKYTPYKNRELMRSYINRHTEYNTILVGYNEENNIVGICRWNITKSGTVAQVLDFVVVEEYRGKNIIKRFIMEALKVYPKMKFITFIREVKYLGREHRFIQIKKEM